MINFFVIQSLAVADNGRRPIVFENWPNIRGILKKQALFFSTFDTNSVD